MPEESALSLVACYVPLLPTLVVCIAKLRIILRLMADLPRLPPLIACEQSLRRAHAILQGIIGIIRFHTVFQAVSTRYFGVPNRTLPAPWIGGYINNLIYADEAVFRMSAAAARNERIRVFGATIQRDFEIADLLEGTLHLAPFNVPLMWNGTNYVQLTYRDVGRPLQIQDQVELVGNHAIATDSEDTEDFVSTTASESSVD